MSVHIYIEMYLRFNDNNLITRTQKNGQSSQQSVWGNEKEEKIITNCVEKLKYLAYCVEF